MILAAVKIVLIAGCDKALCLIAAAHLCELRVWDIRISGSVRGKQRTWQIAAGAKGVPGEEVFFPAMINQV